MTKPRAANLHVLRAAACLTILVLSLAGTACGQPVRADAPLPMEAPLQQPATVPASSAPVQPSAALAEEAEPVPEQPAMDPALEDALLSGNGALPVLLMTEAPGLQTASCDLAVIDYSNLQDGYVMAAYTAQTEAQLRLRVIGPSTTYTYVLTPGLWAAFPLSDGNGDYQVVIYQQVPGTGKYAAVLSAGFTVALEDEFAPFLRPNQYVDYSVAPNAMQKAVELAGNVEDPLETVSIIYTYVVRTLCYDTIKAQSVTTGYLPVLDEVLSSRRGICFDYAALMTGMLRSLGIPCKLVVGYVGNAYHAWIDVYVEGTGWMDGVIYFDGISWQRMDPTFASSAGGTKFIESYIGKGAEYSPRYFY